MRFIYSLATVDLMMPFLRVPCSVVVISLSLGLTAWGQSLERPVRAVTDPGVVTTRQSITPAGIPLIFKGRVYGAVFGDNNNLWVLNATQIYRVDWRTGAILENVAHDFQPAPQGLMLAGGKPYTASLPKRGKSALQVVSGGKVVPVAGDLGTFNAGAPASGNGIAVVPVTANNKVAVVELESGTVRGFLETGIAPFGAVVNQAGTVAWVSNWGGRKPVSGERTMRAGMGAGADAVLVDGLGVTASGTVTQLDLTAMKVTATIPVGLHPNGMVLDEKLGRLYVANNNSDSVTVVDTKTGKALREISIQPFSVTTAGLAPTAVALSADGHQLFVACGGINAVAVVDTATFRSLGMIPTGWYPGSLAVSPEGRYLAVSSMLGVGSGWRDKPAERFVHSYRGSVHVVEIPDRAQLAGYTTAVAENSHLQLAGTPVSAAAPPNRTPHPVPARAGDASQIEHVVYIVRENRTYDQILGDMSKGNGDPKLVMFGPDVTPNAHRLADQYVLLDNFYASGGNSADGHQWLTQANEVSYALWPGYQGRSYPFDGSDPLAISRGGTIWDAARKRGKTVRVYGEYAGSARQMPFNRLDFLKRWKAGEDFSSTWNVTAPVEHMNQFLAHNYPPYSNNIPDVVRASIFQKDLKQWEQAGKMPNLTVLEINCDHTSGTSPGTSTPQAMVADNDLALGQIVDALTKSKFWPKMAIFVVEDDAQAGVDHVDGHRTVALAISPYTRRGHVDSTFYSHPSMLKTIELMLGLPTLSLFDLIANDMRASFTTNADLTAYDHVQPKQDLLAMNPEVKALKGPARQAALASAKMRWDVPDAAPTEKLNRILWHSVRGWKTPYPGVRNSLFAPYSVDIDDDDR